MRIDQLALLFALVIAANLVLLVALELPSLGRRDRSQHGGAHAPRETGTTGGVPDAAAVAAERGTTAIPSVLYQRVVRVVSFMFIGAVLVVESLTGGPRGGVYVLAAVGAFLIVLFQDVLPPSALGQWRRPVEAAAAIVFLALLIATTGGQDSPYFFGYILLLGAASLWAAGIAPPLLAVITSLTYLAAVVLAPAAGPITLEATGRIAFNLVALALVTYVASVIGREQRHAREDALRLSRFDSMTGLYSRDYFHQTMDQEILRAARTGRPFGVVMVDLDGLKAANDRFGHASGDRLLQAISDVLRGDVRVTDIAARFGGDEFVLLLPDTDLTGSMRVAEKVRVDIARLTLPHNGSFIRTSASIGVVTYPDDGRTSSELMRRADLAMYEAKRRGRDQIVRYARETSVPMGKVGTTVTSPPGGVDGSTASRGQGHARRPSGARRAGEPSPTSATSARQTSAGASRRQSSSAQPVREPGLPEPVAGQPPAPRIYRQAVADTAPRSVAGAPGADDQSDGAGRRSAAPVNGSKTPAMPPGVRAPSDVTEPAPWDSAATVERGDPFAPGFDHRTRM